MTLVEQVVRKLGGKAVLGTLVRSQNELALVVREQLPLSVLANLAKAGISEQEIDAFVIPQRTRRHRAAKKQRLTVDESDRTVRMLRIQTLAEEAFGKEKAGIWLRRPLKVLGDETPLEVARTEAGARVIETILGKITWGAAA